MDNYHYVAKNITRTAEISDCGKYRWYLSRQWDLYNSLGQLCQGRGMCSFIMLNPSTADGLTDDATIRRCIGFATDWGFNGLTVRNLFPYRATDSSELLKQANVTGGSRGLKRVLDGFVSDTVVVAWGAFVPGARDKEVLALARQAYPTKSFWCLGETKQGYPRHPLFVPKAAVLQSYQPR